MHRHQLGRLDQGQFREPAEVRLEAPDALLRVEHRVTVPVGTLQFDGEAVRDHPVPRRPGADTGAGAQDHAGEVGADDVVRQIVPPGTLVESAVTLQEPEGRQRFEYRGPYGVVIHRTGHHGDQYLAEIGFGGRHVLDAQRFPGVLVSRRHSFEDADIGLMDNSTPIAFRNFDSGEVDGRRLFTEYGADYIPHRNLSFLTPSRTVPSRVALLAD